MQRSEELGRIGLGGLGRIGHDARGLGVNVLRVTSLLCRLWQVVGRGRGSGLIKGEVSEVVRIAGLCSSLMSFLDYALPPPLLPR